MFTQLLISIVVFILISVSVSIDHPPIKFINKKEYYDEESDFCECIPYWQCNENYTGLSNVITVVADVRSFKVGGLSKKKPAFLCENEFHVCCKQECGRRRQSNQAANEYGLDDSYEFSKRTFLSPLFSPRILGDDNEAEFGEFPWMLGILRNRAFQCGGSLIHPRVALTVAHCIYGKKGAVKVRAGEWNWMSDEEDTKHQDRYAKSMILHEEFNPLTLQNDIALIVLEEPFKLSHSVGVVCIPPKNVFYGKSKCTASGWGKNIYGTGEYQPTLKKTDLPMVNRDDCVQALRAGLGPFFFLDRSFICAGGERDKDTCKGDGGSPLVCPIPNVENRYEQVGLVSWGLRCGQKNFPGVYVNVALFSEWIDGQMKILGFDTKIYRYA